MVWDDNRNGDYAKNNTDIYGCDLSTGTEFPICTRPGIQKRPRISGNVVVWTDYRHWWSEPDIYGAVIPEPAAISLLAVGACLPLLRRRR